VRVVLFEPGDWLIEALTNYLSNAIKFTQSGSINLHVSLKRAPPIHPQEDGGGTSSMSAAGIPRAIHENAKVEDITYVHFEVRDTGRGIPQESVDKLFQPFSQVLLSGCRILRAVALIFSRRSFVVFLRSFNPMWPARASAC
jgi:signal transduction histidine kinase